MRRRARYEILLAAVIGAAMLYPYFAHAQPVIRHVRKLGTFTTNATAHGRDAGNSARIGSRVLWIFGDTFTASGMRSATAAWSRPAAPRNLTESVDEQNAPFQFFPFTADELAFTRAHANPPACCAAHTSCPKRDPYCHCPAGTDCASRVALWPADAIGTDSRGGIAYYQKLIIGVAPFDFRNRGIGLASVQEGAATAARRTDEQGEPVMIFSPTESAFVWAAAGKEPEDPFVYVYAPVDLVVCTADILVGRAPRDHVGSRSAYKFWNGSTWERDLGQARPILRDVAGRLGSVAWNDYLGEYVSGFCGMCTGGTKFHIRSAPRPEGPWSSPVVIDLAPLAATTGTYAGLLHPALGTGRTLAISYYVPAPPFDGRVHLATVTFE